MPIVSLIAAPGALEPALASALHAAWGATGSATWLAPDEAVEFEATVIPGHWRDVWDDLQGQGVDLNVLPEGARRKGILIADMDSTMIAQECVDELAEMAGVGDRVRAITARAMNGELNFEDAMAERVGLLEDLPVSVVADVLEHRITLVPGGKALLATMKANGAYAALVSGGFTVFTQTVASWLGFDEHRANVLTIKGDKLAGGIEHPILGRAAKVVALEDLVARFDLTDGDVLAVGDGANDLGMLGRAGLGVALHAKPAVAAQCEIRINHGDLTALLFLQGYARSEFVDA